MTDLLHSRYRLDEVLGQGAMGVVWRAHDEVLDRAIAVKELRPAPGVDPDEALQRFLVEARAAARLSHPNIVGVHDVFSDDQRVLIVMELVEGPTLDQVMAASGAQSPEVVRAVMAQVAQALASAHGAGVIHRDLKPENIFWTNGRAVVADFGLARIGVGRGTVEGTVMGTPGYMAPEQVRGTPTGPQTDVFGWGAVAYHLAAGRPPFGEQSLTDPSAMAYRIVHEDPPPLHLVDDPALAALITQAMSKDPTHRPGDGMALAGALAGEGLGREVRGAPAVAQRGEAPSGLRAPMTVVADSVHADTRRSSTGRRRRRSLLSGSVAVAVFVGSVFVVLNRQDETPRIRPPATQNPELAAQAFPPFSAPVVDIAHVVPETVVRTVGDSLLDYQARTTNQIAVAVVKSTGRQSIEDYSIELAQAWGVGQKGKDNGVVLVIAVDDHKLRIEVGRGLEGELTDLESGRIIQERLLPLLRQGDVGAAVSQGAEAIRDRIGRR